MLTSTGVLVTTNGLEIFLFWFGMQAHRVISESVSLNQASNYSNWLINYLRYLFHRDDEKSFFGIG